jgi:hypothetical protein
MMIGVIGLTAASHNGSLVGIFIGFAVFFGIAGGIILLAWWNERRGF